MAKELKIVLPEGWSDHSDDASDGPPTFWRDVSEVPSPLQVSWAEYKGGELPNPTAGDLEAMAREFGERQGLGDAVESSQGECEFGLLGTATFASPEMGRVQVWQLSNGRDFILATLISPSVPEERELREAAEIVRGLGLNDVNEAKRWKFW